MRWHFILPTWMDLICSFIYFILFYYIYIWIFHNSLVAISGYQKPGQTPGGYHAISFGSCHHGPKENQRTAFQLYTYIYIYNRGYQKIVKTQITTCIITSIGSILKTAGSFEVSEITATTHVLFLIFYEKPDMVVTNKIKYPPNNGAY
jgi:hypothetical protein